MWFTSTPRIKVSALVSDPRITEAALAAVRGLRDWASLESLGVIVRIGESECDIDNSSQHVVSVSPRDVAEGLVRLSSDPDSLRTWANVLLAGSNFLDLKLEGDPYGQILLEGLWDASDEGRVRRSALLAARELFTS